MQRSDYTNNLHDMNTSSSGITCKNDKQNDDDYITIARDKVFPSASRRYSQDNCTSPEICNQNNSFWSVSDGNIRTLSERILVLLLMRNIQLISVRK